MRMFYGKPKTGRVSFECQTKRHEPHSLNIVLKHLSLLILPDNDLACSRGQGSTVEKRGAEGPCTYLEELPSSRWGRMRRTETPKGEEERVKPERAFGSLDLPTSNAGCPFDDLSD